MASYRSTASKMLLGVAAVVVALTTPTVEGMRSQLEFPACAVNHAPEYFCCEYGSEKEIFTRFNRPSGAAYDQFYRDGWKLSRQVNFPDAFYSPDSPSFHYDEPNQVCRVQRVYNPSTKSASDELQCGPATTIVDSHEGTVVTNDSLPSSSLDATVFWKSRTSARNSNASFPIGATCRSLMLANGRVDETARAECQPKSSPPLYRFNTYTEAPLVLVYVLYGLLTLLLLLWMPLRRWSGVLRRAGPSPTASASPGFLLKPHNYPLHNKQFFDDSQSGGLAMPMLTRRQSEVELRAAADAIEQTGYRDSLFGKCVLAYLLALTVLLVPMMVVLVLDNNYHFTPALFDPVDVLIVAYIMVWLITAVWLSLFVFAYAKLRNFFRVHEPLATCQYVTMFHADTSEIVLADRSGVSQFIAKLELWLFPRSQQGYTETIEVQTSADGHRFVEFQHLRYLYDELYGKFVPGSVPFPETYAQISEQLANGLTSMDVQRREALVGRNSLEVPMPSTITSVAQEVFHFFYVYELMCYCVWFFTGYYIVAVLNAVIIVAVLAFNIYAKRRLLANVLKMTRVQGGVAVYRDAVWQTIKVSQLVPGDLVRVVENWEIPCDMVLRKGTVLCDESSLTGESMPVQKFPISNANHEAYDAEDPTGKKHTLFAGGRTLASAAAHSHQHDELLATVVATGAHTVRGQLVQSILYPAKVRFKYDEHLKACILFLLCYGIIAAVVAMRLLIGNAGLSNTLFAFVYGVFMLSAVLSPLIPVVLTIGHVNASKRLQARGVFCLNATRVPLCGKVRVFAFDKTGTITKKGLDLRGVVPVYTGRGVKFGPERGDVASNEVPLLLTYALASCHAVGYLDDALVGNQVDVKMLEATQWRLVEETVVDAATGKETVRSIVESPDRQHALEILQRFEFDHARASMAVVVEEMHTRRRFVFCKGSYEKLAESCYAQSMPSDYQAKAEKLAKDGCYVLGLGVKELPKVAISLDIGEALLASSFTSSSSPQQQQQQLTGASAKTLVRDDVEKELSLLGLVLFQNELKSDSADVLAKLKEGDIRVLMITGDNAMTGCYIARQSGMVRPGARVILGEILPVNDHGGKALVWRDVDTMETVPSREVFAMAELGGKHQHELDRWELAVTGAAFNYLRKMGELPKLLFHIRIFSRMTPVEKAECVAEMMAAGAVTGMCGDGGNDCGALRIAHVGVALSEDAEASVVSPFTSQRQSIVSVLDVVREGRCSLKTSFGNLKFLIMYGMIGCGLRFTMYANAIFLPEYAFMFCDGLVLVGMSYALSLAKPLRTLGKHRPTASLVGATTILSMLGQELIHIVTLYTGVAMLFDASWYCPFNPQNIDLVKWWLLQDTHLASTLFILVAPQYIVTGLSYGFGSKFHRPVHRNYVLVGYVTLLLSVLLYLAVGEPSAFTDRFRMASSTNVIGLPEIPMPIEFRWKLVLLVACNMLAVVFYERVIVLGPVKRWLRQRFHRDALQLKL